MSAEVRSLLTNKELITTLSQVCQHSPNCIAARFCCRKPTCFYICKRRSAEPLSV
jgi:hypothetical protein